MLKPGMTLAQANAQMKLAFAEFHRLYPQSNPKVGFAVEPLRDSIVGDARKSLLVLLGAVGMVLSDRLRQRGQPAAGAGNGAQTRVRDSIGAGREPLAHRRPTADRERSARGYRRRDWSRARLCGCARAARHQSGGTAAHRRGWRCGERGLAGAWLYARGLAADGNSVWALPCSQRIAHRFELVAEGEQQSRGHRIPAGQGALAAGDQRGLAGAGAADRSRRC